MLKNFEEELEEELRKMSKKFEKYENRMKFIKKRITNNFKKITLELDEGYISCDMCDCCYGQNGGLEPVWCQVFSFRVDPENFKTNRERAKICANYVPKFMERSMVNTPEVERWYEKDSIA